MIPSRWLSTQGISVFQCLQKVKTILISVASEELGQIAISGGKLE